MTTQPDGHVRPFSCGTEGMDWHAANCERCTKKSVPDASGEGPCPMEDAVSMGFIVGTVPAALAVEYGATVDGDYAEMPRQCSQFAPVMVCESHYRLPKGQRKCGDSATETVTFGGLIRPVCPRHGRLYRAHLAREAAQESPSLPSPSEEHKQ